MVILPPMPESEEDVTPEEETMSRYHSQRVQRQIERRNAVEQWQNSVRAQIPPQHLPPVYSG